MTTKERNKCLIPRPQNNNQNTYQKNDDESKRNTKYTTFNNIQKLNLKFQSRDSMYSRLAHNHEDNDLTKERNRVRYLQNVLERQQAYLNHQTSVNSKSLVKMEYKKNYQDIYYNVRNYLIFKLIISK